MHKIDAARRQLLAAIHLHWFASEPIATRVLATNAWEICDHLLDKRPEKLRILQEIASVHGTSHADIRRLARRSRNYFTHADNDPDDELAELDFDDCNAVLLSACLDYLSISGRSPWIFGLFLAWYAALYPEKTGAFCKLEADSHFPGLASLSREEQIRAARQASTKLLPSRAFSDFRLEMSDNWRWATLRKLNLDAPIADSNA